MATEEKPQTNIMQSIFFFFIFKGKYRRRALNNFLKIKKLKNNYIFNLSGTFRYHILGLPFFLFTRLFKNIFKNFIFISCDDQPQIKYNGINIWFGGTSYKLSDESKKLKNNCFVFENFSKKEKNLLNFYPFKPAKTKLSKDHKIVFIGGFNITENSLVDEIWKKEKKNIFDNLTIIDKFIFWKKYDLENHDRLQTFYLQLKERLRFDLILKLKNIFNDKFVLVGTKWKEYNQSAEKDEFDLLKIGHLYNGNICLDLGSKWGSNIFYPRSVEIIEHGGLLFQSEQLNSSREFYDSGAINKFNSQDQLVKELRNLMSNSETFYEKINKQYNFFNNNDLNLSTLNKIYEISKKND